MTELQLMKKLQRLLDNILIFKMAVDYTKVAQLSAIDSLASVTSAAINEVKETAADAIKKVNVSGNTVNFYKNKDAVVGTDTADFTFDFPAEMVIDAAGTEFEPNFTFSSATYTGATDPNLDGKPVLVLAVKTTAANGTVSTAYSFLNLYDLVDIYTIKAGDSAKLLAIDGKEIEVKISATAGNIITANADGFYATTRVTGAVQGNVAIFDANGAPADSGIASDTVLTTSNFATNAEVAEILNTYFPQS